jgi:signal transduction histidine kinase
MAQTKKSPSSQSQLKKSAPKSRFISLRWRFVTPLFITILLTAMVGAYLLASNISSGLEESQENILLQSNRAVADRSADLYDYQRQEAQRVAFTVGVPEAIRDNNAEALEPILESLVRINDLDSVIVTDAAGIEALGVQRVETQGSTDFALSVATSLTDQPIIRSVIDEGFIGATGFLRTPGGIMLFTAVPVKLGDEFIGVALVGQQLEAALNDLQGSASSDLVLYGPDGGMLQTTFPPTETREPLELSSEVFTQALLAVNSVPKRQFIIEEVPYQATYQPFNFGPETLGVVGVLLPDNVPFATEIGRQLTALLASALAGVAVTVGFIGMSRVSGRASRVARVAAELSLGQEAVRTNMQPTDEITAIGHALDRYADYAKEKQDTLQKALRRQRREVNHLMSVLESMPNGVVVQDLDGRVVIMNDHARELLGSQRVFRSSGLYELAEVVGQKLGPSLAPGLYALGDPHRIQFDDRMLNAQAAAVMAMSDRRIGSVILLRDITDEVRQEQQREAILQQLARSIQQPMEQLGRVGVGSDTEMVKTFAREMSRQAVTLQKMIIDLRELSNVDVGSVKRRQRALRLETLVWAVANEWRQVAQANDLTLHVIIERQGLYVLGDEKRLRWAVGNLIDNAIKYTVAGGALTLEIKEESESMANLRIRDNGVGIVKEELAKVFTRFFRGTPTKPNSDVIRTPGMGQGLHIAKQIFESHGGRIQIKSAVGVGTAVYMALPLTAPIGMELPQFQADMDGETVRLSEDILIEIDRKANFPQDDSF